MPLEAISRLLLYQISSTESSAIEPFEVLRTFIFVSTSPLTRDGVPWTNSTDASPLMGGTHLAAGAA